jgi:nucleotide-binding universal stress UspA family protein
VFSSILVAVDGSPAAGDALREAIEIARSDHARLTLISVATPLRWRFSGPPYVPYPSEADLEREAWEVAERAEELVPADIPVSSVVRRGPPAAAIVARAEAGGHDLVVMGCRRHGALGSLLLGSVSRDVVARCPVPVLIARCRPARAGVGEPRDRPGARESRSPGAGVGVQAEPTTRGGAAVFLWLVVTLLLELQLILWMFERMYAS